MSLENTKFCPSCDGGEHESFCTCSRTNPINSAPVAARGLMIECSSCSQKVLEVVSKTTQCSTCFDRLVIQPVLDLRAAMLAGVAECDTKLKTFCEQKAGSSLHTFAAGTKCPCDRVWQTGIDLLNHLPDCQGPPKKESRGTAFVRQQSLADVEELG